MNFVQKNSFKKLFGPFFIIFFSLSFSSIQSSKANKSDYRFQLYESAVKSGELHKKEGNFQHALEAFSLALEFAREMNNKEKEAKCFSRMGLLYWNLGQLKESSEKYTKALSLAQRFNLKSRQRECQNALEIYRLYSAGKKYRSSEKHQKSIESFQRAILLARKTGSKEREVKCLRQLSATYWKLNNLQQFFTLNKEALKIAKKLNHKKEEGRCLFNIGLFYEKLDHYSKSLNYYEEALKIAQSLKNKDDESACLNNIGIFYENIGKYNRALNYLTKALELDRQLENDVYISMDLNNIGETFRRKGLASSNIEDFYKALDYFEQCLRLTTRTGHRKTEIQVLNNIGNVHLDLENYPEALMYFQSGFKKAEEQQDDEAIGMLLNNIGMTLFNIGDYEKATKSYKKAIEIELGLRGAQIIWEAYFGLGQCYEKMNNFSQAVLSYKKAIDVIDHIRSRIFLDTYKASFVRDKLKVYEFLINLLYRLHINAPSNSFGEQIFHIVERAKARAFLESLGESKIDIRERLNPRLKKRENEISIRISSIILNLLKPDLSAEEKEKSLKNLQQEEEEYIRLISKMRAEIPEVANLVLPEPCHVKQVQKQLLDEKTALAEYFLGQNQSFMFFITKHKFNLYCLPSKDEVENSIKAYLKVLSTPPKGKFKGILAAKRLYRELLYHVDRNIPESVENLIVVPDGILYYLAFETLIPSTQSSLSGTDYLVSSYNISYAPSSSVLLFLTEKRIGGQASKGLLAFGNPSYALKVSSKEKKKKSYVEVLKELYLTQGFDFSPLPYSEREIRGISSYFPEEKRDVFVKDKATEDAVKKNPLRDYQVIHFACHGFLDEKFPFRSALVLSLDGDVKEDGFLHVREIYNLRMKADLIVLSACQTGKGKLEKGEGIFGLPRIFFYAGAKSVVSTLWRIDDESTAMFMSYFYCNLSQGNDIAQALRSAKLKMMESKFSHPFYWAAFILHGDYSSGINFKGVQSLRN